MWNHTTWNVVHRFQIQFKFNKAMFLYRYTHLLIPTKWLCLWVSLLASLVGCCFCFYIALCLLNLFPHFNHMNSFFPFACIELMLFVSDIRHIHRCILCVCARYVCVKVFHFIVKLGVFHSTSMFGLSVTKIPWTWWP